MGTVGLRQSRQPSERFTCDLRSMADWLKARKVRHIAMESTGVYGKPVWNVLESTRWKFDLLLVNPQLVRALPGKKTDREDSERISGYLQQGLLRGSFVPPKGTRELRELTRRRAHRKPRKEEEPAKAEARTSSRPDVQTM
jgi:transposase